MPGAPALAGLYVPGDRPERFAKAAASGADFVIIDLEDAVSPGHKATAREHAARYLASDPPVPTVVRINGADTPWHTADLTALQGAKHLGGVRLPKTDSAQDVALVRGALPNAAIHAMVESPRGVQNLAAIASAPGVVSVGLGEADLRSALGITAATGLDWIRAQLVLAAAAAGLNPPMMSVWTDLGDPDGLAESCRAGKAHGFLGRTAIHPRQVPIIRTAFLPTAEDVAHARAVIDALDAASGGVAVLANGRMVDAAMRVGAERTLALAEDAGH